MKKIFSIGTYTINGDFEKILLTAWHAGYKFIDTAPNYRNGDAHKEIADLIDQALEKKVILNKDEIIVSTKIGFIPKKYKESLINNDTISPDDTYHDHNIGISYLKWQFMNNLEGLNLPKIETLFLHNPENQINIKSKKELHHSIRDAFEYFEELASDRLIEGYGISTWTGFDEKDGEIIFEIDDLYNIARDIAGNHHHFSHIQLPLSLIKLNHLSSSVRNKNGILEDAKKHNLVLHVSSPLHGGKLPKIISKELCNFFGTGLSPAQCALIFSKSYSSVHRVITSPSSLSQLEDSFVVTDYPNLDDERLSEIIDLIS